MTRRQRAEPTPARSPLRSPGLLLHLPIALLLSVAATASPAAPPRATPPQNTALQAISEHIPDVHGTSLDGRTVDLPAQLRGRAAVLVLGFTKDARTPVRDWGRRLAADYAASPTISYFEMPVLASVPRHLRGFVLRQIAADVSDRGKPHFVAITADEPRWRALVHYNQPADAYVLLVDSNGVVRTTLSGPLTAAAYTALQRDIAALAPSSR